MAFISYNAKRDMIPGRVEGYLVEMEFGTAQHDKKREPDTAKAVSISKRAEFTYRGAEEYYEVNITPIHEDDPMMPVWDEFFASCEGGEYLSFDKDGTVASHPDALTYTLDNYSSLKREGQTKYFAASFKLRRHYS